MVEVVFFSGLFFITFSNSTLHTEETHETLAKKKDTNLGRPRRNQDIQSGNGLSTLEKRHQQL